MITDGQPNVDKEMTMPECRKTENQKVQMFSVGITKEVDERTLKMLSSEPHMKDEDYFMTPDFQGLEKIIRSVINSTCYKPTDPPTTPAPSTTTTPSEYSITSHTLMSLITIIIKVV